MTLRTRLFLFLSPAMFATFAFTLVGAHLISSQWASLWHPMILLSLLWTGSLAIITWVVFVALYNMTASMRYITNIIATPLETTIAEPTFALSDVSEIQDLYYGVMRMRVELKRSYEELEENARLAGIGHVAAQVLHDTGAPLATLTDLAQCLQQEMTKEPWVKPFHGILMGAVQRIQDIRDDLLNRYMDRQTSVGPILVAHLLEDIANNLKTLKLAKQVVWEKQYNSPQLQLIGSWSLLNRCISNIVKNALEALEHNKTFERRITLSLSSITEECFEIRLQDNGPGIPKAVQAQILQGGVSIGKENGHGLGMQVARQAVEFHRGRLTVESIEQEGTTFIITLPVQGCNATVDNTAFMLPTMPALHNATMKNQYH